MGELRIKIDKVQSPSTSNRSLAIGVNSPTNIRIIGSGYFTDENFSANKGKSLLLNSESLNYIYVSNDDITISIENKYNLTKFNCKAVSNPWEVGNNHTNIHINIEDFKYSTALTGLGLSSTSVSGDIAAVKNLTALTSLKLTNTFVSGDISAIGSLSKLISCGLNSVTGDISVLNNTKLADILISNSGGLTGDIAKLNANFKYLGLNNDNTSRFNWSSRDSGSVIFGNGGSPILISNLDDMLINMAQCRNGITSSSASWEKNISYHGNRTSASDSAVEKLQGYGYNININRV